MKCKTYFLKNLFLFFILLITVLGCTYKKNPRKSQTGDLVEAPFSFKDSKNSFSDKSNPPSVYAGQAISIIESKCMICHNGAAAPTNWGISNGSTEAIWVSDSPAGLIIPGDAENSRLVKFMRYSPNGAMPPAGMAFERSEYDTIVLWINSINPPTSGGGGSSGGTDLGKSGEGIFLSQDRLRLGDRNYVARVLEEIFGPNEESKKIRGKVLAFGGPCPINAGWNKGSPSGNIPECIHLDEPIIYSSNSHSFENKGVDPDKVDLALADIHLDKVDMATADASMVPESDVVREGYRTLACEKLLFNFDYSTGAPSPPLLKAITHIKNFSDASLGQPIQTIDFSNYPVVNSTPSEAEIVATFRMFYNFRAPTEKQILTLKAVVDHANNEDIRAVGNWPKRFEPWRYLLYTICLAPDWQIP